MWLAMVQKGQHELILIMVDNGNVSKLLGHIDAFIDAFIGHTCDTHTCTRSIINMEAGGEHPFSTFRSWDVQGHNLKPKTFTDLGCWNQRRTAGLTIPVGEVCGSNSSLLLRHYVLFGFTMYIKLHKCDKPMSCMPMQVHVEEHIGYHSTTESQYDAIYINIQYY